MKKMKEDAFEILNISKEIYQIQEKHNPNTIFKNKIFIIGTENNRESISIEQDYEDNFLLFYTPNIRGVIIKKESGYYCIKAAVRYANTNNLNLWFAKIRIENFYDKDIQVMGMWGGG